MKKAMILLGSVKHNKGSEAIGRGLAEILHKTNPDLKITLSSNITEDDGIAVPFVDKYIERIYATNDRKLQNLYVRAMKKLFRSKQIGTKLKYKFIADEGKDTDVLFFIGGDNFDKNYASFEALHEINWVLDKVRKPQSLKLLYDCSFEPGEFDDEIRSEIETFDMVTAREKITHELLEKQSLRIPLHYFPDPAFCMSPQETPLPEGFVAGNTVGVNLSPTVMAKEYGNDEATVLKAYLIMLQSMIEKTDCHILLIPHVQNNQDLSVLKKLYHMADNPQRISLLEDQSLNAAQLKYIISQCTAFVGARTHSTIAAYSSCVPTMVIGYSVKSRGIAKDLFDDENAHVIQVGNVKNETVLSEMFLDLYHNRSEIRKHLQEVMPGYVEKALSVGTLVNQLLWREKNDSE